MIQKKIYFDDIIKEKTKAHNSNWPKFFDHLYRILIIRGSGSGKTNSLFNLITQEPYIIYMLNHYLYAKHPCGAKYQFLINKRKSTG